MSRDPHFVPQGVIPAVLLPFHEDLSIDEPSFRAHVRDVGAVQGLSAITVNAHSTEVASCTEDEQRRVMEIAGEEVGGTLPIIHGVYADGSLQAARIARQAQLGGASALLVFPPAPFTLGQSTEMALAHFKTIGDATDLPLGIYNNPPRVKSDLHWDHLLRIFKHPNYVVHKESTARVGQVAQVLAAKPKVSVMCCDSPNLGLVVPTMSLGGHGTANMTGNIAPTELAIISTPWTGYAEAENFKTTYLKLLPLLHFTYSAINPVAVKSLMKALSLPAGDLRKPLTNLDGEALAKGVRIVQELGLDKQYGYKVGPISAVAA